MFSPIDTESAGRLAAKLVGEATDLYKRSERALEAAVGLPEIRDRVVQERAIDREFKGDEAAASGKIPALPEDGALIEIAKPQGSATPSEFPPGTRVFFVNGINTQGPRAYADAQMVAARTHTNLDLVYVKTHGIVADVETAATETLHPEVGKQLPPERTLANEIVKSLDRGQDVHVVAYSRGALVTQLALENVRDHYAEQGRSDAWIEAHVATRMTVESFNGASHNVMPGVEARHYVTRSDYLVGQTIGMGAEAPVIRSLAAHGIDEGLRLLNDLDLKDRLPLARDVVKLAIDVAKEPPLFDIAGQIKEVALVTKDVQKIANDIELLIHKHSRPGPGEREIARDGYANTPNGPIVGVPANLDVDRLKHANPEWIVDQHDFAQMLPYRGAADGGRYARLESAVGAYNAAHTGHALPQPHTAHEWDGDRKSGVVLELAPDRYAIANLKTGEYEFFRGEDARGAAIRPGTTMTLEAETLRESVDRLRPQSGSGEHLPAARSVEPWRGKAFEGTGFALDDDTYAVHAGRGNYQTFAIAREAMPPDGAFVRADAHGAISEIAPGAARTFEHTR